MRIYAKIVDMELSHHDVISDDFILRHKPIHRQSLERRNDHVVSFESRLNCVQTNRRKNDINSY